MVDKEFRDFPGILNNVKMTSDEVEVFLEYMKHSMHSESLHILYNVFSQKDMLKFLDMFSGRTIKTPKRRDVVRNIEYVKIYVYLRERGNTEMAIYDASRVFNKRVSSIVRIRQKVEDMISGKETIEDE